MTEIVVFAEHSSDARTICGIADRILLAHAPADWDERENVASPDLARRRTWVGLDDGATFFDLHHLKARAGTNPRQFVRRPYGESRGYDSATVRIALQLCVKRAATRPDTRGLLFIRDLDAQGPERIASAEAASTEAGDAFPALFAWPDPSTEAWLLHGFIPQNHAETKRLEEERAALHFDPTTASHLLRAANEGEPRNPKRVLRVLTDSDNDRVEECWEKTPLQTLRDRGEHSGLRAFFEQVETKLIPLLPELEQSKRH